MDHWLGKILVDQVRKGLKIDNVFQTEAYDKAVSAMNAKFGHHLTKFHIKNRLKTWKKQYEIAKEILSHAGFKWDETKKMIIANDSTWIDYIRVCFHLFDLHKLSSTNGLQSIYLLTQTKSHLHGSLFFCFGRETFMQYQNEFLFIFFAKVIIHSSHK